MVLEALELKFLKIMYVYKIRWVASKVGTIKAIIRNWKSVIVHLKSATQEMGTNDIVAKGLLEKLKNFRILTLHFFFDCLTIFK